MDGYHPKYVLKVLGLLFFYVIVPYIEYWLLNATLAFLHLAILCAYNLLQIAKELHRIRFNQELGLFSSNIKIMTSLIECFSGIRKNPHYCLFEKATNNRENEPF